MSRKKFPKVAIMFLLIVASLAIAYSYFGSAKGSLVEGYADGSFCQGSTSKIVAPFDTATQTFVSKYLYLGNHIRCDEACYTWDLSRAECYPVPDVSLVNVGGQLRGCDTIGCPSTMNCWSDKLCHVGAEPIQTQTQPTTQQSDNIIEIITGQASSSSSGDIIVDNLTIWLIIIMLAVVFGFTLLWKYYA
jgi:hypothetical protein